MSCRHPETLGAAPRKDAAPYSPQPNQAQPHTRSNRSAFMTLFHAATKSLMNFGCEPALA